MVYKIKEGSHLSIDAQEAGERIEIINKLNGIITPELVLKDARNDESPLHEGFDWDDSTAAEAYRLDQARYILRSIVVVTSISDEETKTIRAFVSVKPTEGEKIYTTIAYAMSDTEFRQQLIDRAYKELQQWSTRYKELVEFKTVHEAVQSIQFEVELV